jgi:hypothetical protein
MIAEFPFRLRGFRGSGVPGFRGSGVPGFRQWHSVKDGRPFG